MKVTANKQLMKIVNSSELKIGDIITKRMELKNREALIVVDITEKDVICHSRIDTKKVKEIKKIKKDVQIIKLN